MKGPLCASIDGFSAPRLDGDAGPGCLLLASPDAVVLALPSVGALATPLAIPNSTAFAGVRLHEQVVTAEINAQGAIVAITSSNALRLTIGSL